MGFSVAFASELVISNAMVWICMPGSIAFRYAACTTVMAMLRLVMELPLPFGSPERVTSSIDG